MQGVEIPRRLKSRPQYKGFPIPFTVLVDANGIPDFKTTDLDKWYTVIEKKLCGLCGHQLGQYIFFIGGENSCQHRHFFDPPMHKDCAEYSMKICPFLTGNKDYAHTHKEREGYEVTIHDEEAPPPSRMGLYKCGHYSGVWDEAGKRHVLRAGPAMEIIWYDRTMPVKDMEEPPTVKGPSPAMAALIGMATMLGGTSNSGLFGPVQLKNHHK